MLRNLTILALALIAFAMLLSAIGTAVLLATQLAAAGATLLAVCILIGLRKDPED